MNFFFNFQPWNFCKSLIFGVEKIASISNETFLLCSNFILFFVCLKPSGFNGTLFLSCRSNFQIHEAKQYETIKITSSLNVSNRNIMEAIFFRFIHLQFDSFVVCDKFIIFSSFSEIQNYLNLIRRALYELARKEQKIVSCFLSRPIFIRHFSPSSKYHSLFAVENNSSLWRRNVMRVVRICQPTRPLRYEKFPWIIEWDCKNVL